MPRRRRRRRALRPLSEIQADFAAALLDPAAPPPSGLVDPAGRPAPRRFAVYRNNVLVGLTKAVTDSFPAVGRITGADFLRAMARAYVLAEPPRSAVLLDYGAGFPRFVEAFEPARRLPYLADVARIERGWREAYHSAEAGALAPAALATIPPEALADVRFGLHPSLRLVRSRFPALTVWRMNVGDGPVTPVDFSVAEDALITRPDADVEVRAVPPGGAEFVAALGRGETLGAAADRGLAADSRFDLAGNIAGLFAAGALVSIDR